MNQQQQACIQSYVALLDDLLAGRISLSGFEKVYLSKFKSEQVNLPEGVFAVLDHLFGDVDAFCADPSVRGLDGIGEIELLASVKGAMATLKRLSSGQNDAP